MKHTIYGDKTVSVGTSAVNVELGYRGVIIKNASANRVFFRDKDIDGKNVTAATGMLLAAGETFPVPLCAKTLSLIADAAGSDVRLLLVEEEM